MNYNDINSKNFDRWIEDGWKWGVPITSEVYQQAKNGDWKVQLATDTVIPKEWFGDLKDKNILGLAAGGGQQLPIFSALGARCTLLDYSDRQLQTEQFVADREGYHINLVKADMTKPLPFDNESFDMIFHPASTEFIEEVEPLFKECYRILKKGGVILSALSTFINYIVDETEEKIIFSLPFNPLKNPKHARKLMEWDAGYQFSHTAEEQIGSLLKAGFVLTDIKDETNGEGRLHEMGIPTYMLIRAIKTNTHLKNYV